MIFDIYPNDLIEKAAEELKKIPEVTPPSFTVFAKTGAHKERAPDEPEWWFKRVAAILRSIYVLGPIGVSKLRIKYGGKKRRGHKPSHFKKGSGSVIRKALQQLDKAGFTKFAEKGIHKGRVITPKGKSFLDKIAVNLSKQKPKPKITAKPKQEEKKEIKKIPTAKELIEKTKERFQKGPVTAEQLIDEAKKTKEKSIKKVPAAHELAKKAEEKQ
ncbi:30S ribosomal protein S19e [Candidatus Woesearchaeota archaeon]|nr:30S ribosomal protein S19e [Candidatus Woesearchaeota archaeon]